MQLREVWQRLAIEAPPTVDPEAYQRLLLTTRAIAASRPNNLMTFASQHDSRSASSGDDKETLIVQVSHD